MSVYTTVTLNEMKSFIALYNIGELISYKGISGGITNTNYFIDTEHGRYVLTLFEVLKWEEIPFFLELTLHLNQNKVACPAPIYQKNHHLFSVLNHKPATLMTCLNGTEITEPNPTQCFNVGKMLAKLHLAGQSFKQEMKNPRGLDWIEESAKLFYAKLKDEQLFLLNDEINFQLKNNHTSLPSGIIHADLFKDNVLMNEDKVAGFIDFYYACHGYFIYDLAIAINDWAQNKNQEINHELKNAMLTGYESERILTTAEKSFLPIAQRTAALRFWVSRLIDFHFPQEGEMTFTKDPKPFQDLLMFLRT